MPTGAPCPTDILKLDRKEIIMKKRQITYRQFSLKKGLLFAFVFILLLSVSSHALAENTVAIDSASGSETTDGAAEDVICNFGEIAPLKKVLIQRPGNEFLNLTPDSLDRLLFDDIPYLRTAQEEHDALAKVLREQGVEVVYLTDLAAEALDAGGPEVREAFLKQFIAEAGISSQTIAEECYAFLDRIEDNRDLIRKCIAGTDASEIENLSELWNYYSSADSSKLLLDPIPNIYFERDPMATVGNGVTIHNMWSETRTRESIFADYVFQYHPDYQNVRHYYDRSDPYSLEGGDIQVLSDEVIAVGISQRTEPDAIALFAKNLFADESSPFRYVLAIDIPDERSYMHLDTVMTQVDVDKFAVLDAVTEISAVYVITKGADEEPAITELHQPLSDVLQEYLHLDNIELIECGNGNRIDAEREQWSDGVNLLCLRPGVVIAYDRNFMTNQALRDHGIEVIEVPSAELSRGRGGSHCMTMALVRERSISQ